MTSDPTKPPRPEDERERTARFEADEPEAEGEDAPGGAARESTARFIPEEEPPQLEETTSILSAEDLEAAELPPVDDRDSTARIEISEQGLPPEPNDRDSTARLQPEDLEAPEDHGGDQEPTRRENTPLPRLPDDSFSAPHTPAPGTRLDDTSPEKLSPTRQIDAGAPTRKDMAAPQETAREQPTGEAPTRADSPLSAQSTRKEEITPIEPLGVSAAGAEAATGRQSVPPFSAPAAAEETVEEELEKPFSLQPEEMANTGTQGSAVSRKERRVPMPLWFLLFVLVGIGLFAAMYFRPRTVVFPLPTPRSEVATPIAIPGVTDDPPKTWALQDGMFYGKDVLSRPWVYEPASGKVMHAAENISAIFAAGTFTVVAHPPLEAGTRLAWIADLSASSSQLLCRDYNFTADVEPAPAQQALNTLASLPAGKYPFAPLAIDTADHAVGTVLVVVNTSGGVMAYRPESPTPGEPFWTATLTAKPLAAPLRIYNGDAAKPAYYVLIATDKGMQSFDSISGKQVGVLDWGKPIVGDLIVLGAQRIPGNREHWGVMAWDGATAYTIDTKPDGQLALVETIDCGGTPKTPVRMVGFPDSGEPSRDGALLAAADGSMTVLTKAGNHALPGNGAAAGAITTIDLNGDGYWELITIKPNGEFWVVEGSSLKAGAKLDWHRIEMTNYAAAPATRVYWHIEGEGLIADYFDVQGAPQRLALDLPPVSGVQRTAIVDDFNRRRVLR